MARYHYIGFIYGPSKKRICTVQSGKTMAKPVVYFSSFTVRVVLAKFSKPYMYGTHTYQPLCKLEMTIMKKTTTAFLGVAIILAGASAAMAKPPKEGDVYHYYGRGGECLEDTWEAADEGTGFEPAGGWGPCPIAKPHGKGQVVKQKKKKHDTH